MWDVASHTLIAVLEAGTAVSVSFSPDGRTLASGGSGGVLLWDVASRPSPGDSTTYTSPAVLDERSGYHFVSFSPDGRTLASGTQQDGTVRLWDVANRTQTAVLEGHKNVNSVSFSPDGRTLASAGGNRFSTTATVRLWDVDSRTTIAVLEGHEGAVTSVSFSPDGRTLASAGKNSVRLWDVAPYTVR